MISELKTGILIVNLGTPDSPSTSDVRKYLREFLMDPRVIDIPEINRWLLVNLIIAPIRGPKSAKLYEKIWTEKGSPLLHYTKKQSELLQRALGPEFQVEYAMRYQNPHLKNVLEKFRKPGFKKIRVIPLFPQYASASTGSVHEYIMQIISKWEVIPEIELVNSFCHDAGFINAFATRGRFYDHRKYDHVLFSFHGLPERQIRKADSAESCLKENCCAVLAENNASCYRAQCFETARKIAGTLQISPDKYTVCFQSRLGRTPWIKPYSDLVIRERAEIGNKKILVFAPAFVSDCLETIYEIGTEYNELFRKHGGEEICMVESLNDLPSWIEALKVLAEKQQG